MMIIDHLPQGVEWGTVAGLRSSLIFLGGIEKNPLKKSTEKPPNLKDKFVITLLGDPPGA